MSDTIAHVYRLRGLMCSTAYEHEVTRDAADEIMRLERELAAANAQIEKLREALTKVRRCLSTISTGDTSTALRVMGMCNTIEAALDAAKGKP